MPKLTPAQKKERNRLRYENRKRKRSEKDQESSANKQATKQQEASGNLTVVTHEAGNHHTDPANNSQAQPTAHQHPTTESSGQLSRDKFARTRLIWTIINSVCTLIFTGAVAIFSGFQVYYGNKQWEAMREQNIKFDTQIGIMNEQISQTDDNLELMRQGQRAWLGVVANELEQPFVAGKEFNWRFQAQNSGNTPATITQQIVVRVPLPATTNRNNLTNFLTTQSARGAMATNVPANGHTQIDVSLNALNATDIDDITKVDARTGKPKKILFIFGRLHYTDRIGVSDIVPFYYEWRPEKNRLYVMGVDSGEESKQSEQINPSEPAVESKSLLDFPH